MIMQQGPEHLPSRLIFEITEVCNYRCLHCFVPHRPRMPSKADAIEILTRAATEGIPSVSWTGGEPYLRQDLFEIAEALPKGGTVHTINTNGSMITPNLAHRTAAHFSLARVSIFGSAQSYAQNISIRARRFNYQTPFNAIRLFLTKGIRVQVNVPVISESLNDIPDIIKDLKHSFGSNLEEIVLIPTTKVGPIEYSPLRFPSEEAVSDLQEKLTTSASCPVRLFVWKPGKHMLIKADGLAYAHPIKGQTDGVLLVGNPLTESFAAVWANFPSAFKQDHRALTPSVNHLKR